MALGRQTIHFVTLPAIDVGPIYLNVRVYSSFGLHVRFGLLCSISCMLVKLHILVKFLLYKLCYHLDGE